ncbi:uncharacterized protein LOC128678473 [Plodia interpunctella]|uniref:uncharacterized protein LOC128678473 n=1 Tax=Plodia interpunctella TaxID=58824 RepID=UPI0023683387|nr:uncharacterized protein LOC128678473 [Plodia interpunctella]
MPNPIIAEMANRPTLHQIEALVEFLEQNQGIARGLLRTQQAKVETKRKWQEFAVTTNAMGGVIKNGQAWAKYWAEKKSALKKLCQQRAQSMRRTGGGLDMVPELSLAVMGGDSFATGTIGIAVDPFPQSNSSPSILIDLPSTSQAAAETLEKEIQNPHSPVEAGLQVEQSEQQGDTSFVLPSESCRVPRLGQQSRHNRRVSFVDSQVRRFEEIESRRVEAEMLNAQAQVQTAQALAQLAAAVSDTGQTGQIGLATALSPGYTREHFVPQHDAQHKIYVTLQRCIVSRNMTHNIVRDAGHVACSRLVSERMCPASVLRHLSPSIVAYATCL